MEKMRDCFYNFQLLVSRVGVLGDVPKKETREGFAFPGRGIRRSSSDCDLTGLKGFKLESEEG